GICGIVNGSTNYILTKIIDNNLPYKDALLEAQVLGFAETDPALDVEGVDAANKLSILLAHAYGIITTPDKLLHRGITQIHESDAGISAQKNFQIKLIAQAKKLKNGKVAAAVLPQFVTRHSQLFNVKNEFNGVVVESSFADKQFLYGKGAGRFPTASAVLSDISALRYNYKYEYRKLNGVTKNELTTDFFLRLYVSFNSWKEVDLNNFEYLEELYCQGGRQYLIGVIHYEKLCAADWFQSNELSVIVCPDGIVDNLEIRNLKRKSLSLGGIKDEEKIEDFVSSNKHALIA
ncbi:MAG: homoserine dehydrogenase, partial [Chitinophagaceae bacterium]|nr:homoserine dehydrogenase [Chitinophagaceae bacterium]